jgi:hypothetical protein
MTLKSKVYFFILKINLTFVLLFIKRILKRLHRALKIKRKRGDSHQRGFWK